MYILSWSTCKGWVYVYVTVLFWFIAYHLMLKICGEIFVLRDKPVHAVCMHVRMLMYVCRHVTSTVCLYTWRLHIYTLARAYCRPYHLTGLLSTQDVCYYDLLLPLLWLKMRRGASSCETIHFMHACVDAHVCVSSCYKHCMLVHVTFTDILTCMCTAWALWQRLTKHARCMLLWFVTTSAVIKDAPWR